MAREPQEDAVEDDPMPDAGAFDEAEPAQDVEPVEPEEPALMADDQPEEHLAEAEAEAEAEADNADGDTDKPTPTAPMAISEPTGVAPARRATQLASPDAGRA